MKKKFPFIVIIPLLAIIGLAVLAFYLYGLSEKMNAGLRDIEQGADRTVSAIREMKNIPKAPDGPGSRKDARDGTVPDARGGAVSGTRPALPEAQSEESIEKLSETAAEDVTEALSEAISEAVPGQYGLAEALSEEAAESIMTEEESEGLPPVPADHHVIFLGDSRTVGMGTAEKKAGDRCIYIGESGEGYNWLIDYGIDLLDTAIRAWPSSPVIINFGVNDCDAIYKYIEVYRELEKGYPQTRFFYMSVNPVTEESPHVPLSDVLVFNTKLRAAFPDQYIDTCSWMLKNGYEDVDGVHYSGKQYRRIHDYAVLEVFRLLGEENEEDMKPEEGQGPSV